MQKNRWQQIEEIFNRAAVLPAAEKRKFIEDVCREDADLCREVLLLIETDEAENSFLNEPVFSLGAQLLENDSLELLKDENFADYKLKKLLGRGGMGTVFLAEDTRLARPVALKILPSSLGTNAEGVLRFRQEARTASAISHPNVAHIYEFGEAGGRYFLAMEYVEGKTLRELLKENSIDVSRALEIALQIADALAATHKRGIVHRDIKPENVIVTESGLVKVLDFGLAKLNAPPTVSPDEKALASLETIPGMIIGTTAYMSPEQVRGQTLDARTDLWSLGVLLFEMLAGERPFAGETPSDIQAAILLKDVPLIELPTFTAIIVSKLLKKNLNERYQSIEEFIPDLHQVKNEFATGKTADELSKAETISSQDPTEKKREFLSKSNLPKFVLPLILFLAISFSAVYFNASLRRLFFDEPQTAQTKKINSLVVLPFHNASDEPQFDYLSQGLAEDLTRNLGRLNVVRVTAFGSALKMRDTTDLNSIRERLNVESCVRGRIEKRDGKLFVSIEFLETNSGAVLWQDSVSANDSDLLKLRDSLAVLLSTNLQSNFGGTKNLVVSESSTRSEAAYREYLAGRFAPDRNDLDGTKRAVTHLERAVALDTNFAQGFVALAEAYNLIGAWHGEKPEIYLPKAKTAVERALILDESSAEAHTILAKMKMDQEHDWAATEREFKRAVELNPNYALAHHWFGEVYLSAMGRFDESIRELETAHRLNPLSTGIITGLAHSYVGKREYEKAIAMCDEALRLNPSDDTAFSYKSMALMKLGRLEEAIETIRRASTGADSGELAVYYALAGRAAEAHKILQKKQREPDVSPYTFAVIYAALGEKDRAFELLEKQLKTSSVDLLSIRLDPFLDVLRDDARFAEIERKLNLPVIPQN